MEKYYRTTVYHPVKDICAIIDCYGKFKEPWQLSVYLIPKGFKVIEIGDAEKFGEGNLSVVPEKTDKLMLRACANGKPVYDGNAVNINGKYYFPNKDKGEDLHK